jgi:hypothetical protein
MKWKGSDRDKQVKERERRFKTIQKAKKKAKGKQ